jgi:uncharacterized membrane protein
MPAYLVSYGATVIVLLACDMVWLSTVGAGIYRPRLGDLLLDRPVLWAAALFYLVYGVGVVIFAVAPGLRQESWPRALGLGALFGLFAYATYDLTNLATMRGWSVLVSVLDIAWGACLTAVAAAAGTYAAMRVGAML